MAIEKLVQQPMQQESQLKSLTDADRNWTTVERPGYLGKKRDEIYSIWNDQYGKDNWRLAYSWKGLVVPREFGIQLYEDAYCEFLKKDTETLDWLVSTASNVYDTAPTNLEAGFDYFRQETPNNHIHDVSIRRAVARLGRWFEGDKLIHVRWKDTEGFRLSPGIVPFHMPDDIAQDAIKDYAAKGRWWNSGTIEDFYQKNKILQVRK
jgi:hypothetical protein